MYFIILIIDVFRFFCCLNRLPSSIDSTQFNINRKYLCSNKVDWTFRIVGKNEFGKVSLQRKLFNVEFFYRIEKYLLVENFFDMLGIRKLHLLKIVLQIIYRQCKKFHSRSRIMNIRFTYISRQIVKIDQTKVVIYEIFHKSFSVGTSILEIRYKIIICTHFRTT